MTPTFKQIYRLCQKYGTKKGLNASGGTYTIATPKKCAEKIMKLLEEKP